MIVKAESEGLISPETTTLVGCAVLCCAGLVCAGLNSSCHQVAAR
jgi:hypothetical protein